MKKIFTALACSVVLFSGCQKEDLELNVTIAMDDEVVATVGQTKQLTATVTPQEVALSAAILWESGDPSIATVNASGLVTALSVGTTVITAKLQNDASVSAQCTLQVVNPGEDPDAIVVFEDSKFETFILLSYDMNEDGKLQASEAKKIVDLNVAMKGFSSLKGIEFFTGLETLYCEYNSLKTLDVTNCPDLRELVCYNNGISSLDVSKNTRLEVLNCNYNSGISELDVTNCPDLRTLECGGNALTELDVTKNPKLERLRADYNRFDHLDVSQNPELRYLDVSYSSYFVSTATQKYNSIGEIDLSNNAKLEYFNGNMCAFKQLDLSANKELRNLRCLRNELTSLDVSNNTKLTTLVCSNNPIGALDITMCPEIDTLWCEDNGLEVLDLTQSRELRWLNCSRNEIGELDFSHTKLCYLLGQENKISRINMGTAVLGTATSPNYLYMKLNDNRIESIDLSNQPHLAWLEIKDNNLSSLDVNACTRLRGILCSDNPQMSEFRFERLGEVWEIRCEGCNLSGELDFSGISGLSKISCQENNLSTLYVWEGFDEDATYFFADHTTGFSGTLKCYVKDDTAVWVVKK